jgi:hypothetical protein
MTEKIDIPMGEVESFAGKLLMVCSYFGVIIISLWVLYPI